jgi:hypothetical protein
MTNSNGHEIKVSLEMIEAGLSVYLGRCPLQVTY